MAPRVFFVCLPEATSPFFTSNHQGQVEVERKLALEAEAGKFRPGETSGLEYPDSGKGSHLD